VQMLHRARMKGLIFGVALVTLTLPSTALAAGTVSGATHAVVNAIAEEGGNAVYYGTPQVHCRRTTPSHFGCSFFNLTRELGGRVTVTYMHGHYYVGEPRYEAPREYGPVNKPCDITPGGC
jgi:hypothetical protein